MKKILLLVFVAAFMMSCNKKKCVNPKMNLLPYPNSIVKGDCCIDLSKGVKLIGADKYHNYFESELKTKLDVVDGNVKIEFKTVIGNSSLGEEGYKLIAKDDNVVISASGEKGFFYGFQTFLQLIDSKKIPEVTIDDKPAFAWRAYMLDESRYFHGMEAVKNILDEMAHLKMNVFHWHLTDDAGWRIEIKKYPLLTEVGSKRTDSQIGGWKSEKRSGKPHSGYYTQEQIKEIVKYASERNITVVPEIEMPGHSTAAIASYPWLGTIGKKIEVPVTFGKKKDNYNVINPKVIQFLHDVLDETMALFPSKVIHIGGDEVKFDCWNESKAIQAYLRANGLKSSADLQLKFTNDISKYIESKGRRMMGWNEIVGQNIHEWMDKKEIKLSGELSKKAVVHFWKGDVKLITDAAQKGYEIVNSTHQHTYLDYNYKSIPLKKAYKFNPVPNGLDKKYHNKIKGLGCQMWSEWTPTNNDVYRMSFPRIAAYAEVGWTKTDNKNYDRFLSAINEVTKRWENKNITYNKEQIK